MCLLVVLSRIHPDSPLVVGANRDELLARPARAMERLSDAPRILGGRDLHAGGTWLAINEHGVIAALTNTPSPGGRDPTKKSRGALPLRLAAHADAASAAAEFERVIDGREYNPCWLVVADRSAAFYFELNAAPLHAEPLPPGLWVLENRPLRAPSPKADAVRAALAGAASWRGSDLPRRLADVLRSHATFPLGDGASAPCVHAGEYGTRSSAIVVVPAYGDMLPEVRYSEGPPCTTEYRDAAAFWG